MTRRKKAKARPWAGICMICEAPVPTTQFCCDKCVEDITNPDPRRAVRENEGFKEYLDRMIAAGFV